jgi:hypothetical protein
MGFITVYASLGEMGSMAPTSGLFALLLVELDVCSGV